MGDNPTHPGFLDRIIPPGRHLEQYTPSDHEYDAMHALLIGIDTYRSGQLDPLRGAVADAEAVNRFLCDELHVPDSQIVLLRNEEATQDAILERIEALGAIVTLHRDDPILIYFAGHGAATTRPDPDRAQHKDPEDWQDHGVAPLLGITCRAQALCYRQ